MQPAIRVENLGKAYVIDHESNGRADYKTLRESVAGAIKASLKRCLGTGNGSTRSEEFWALKDVSFEVQPGEVVGIIGRNGAGKSTLLKILSRITKPTTGHIALHGRVGSLLEVGTGFHPELTGRENVYLNGSILGMARSEIDMQFDAIVDFSGVEKFLDTPVKRYSSGMYVRLAFAVAAHLNPEILIVDEVLAVGDAEFQKKCLGKMKDVASGGRTVLFVSHNMNAVVSLCSRAVHLQRGEVVDQGDVADVLAGYVKAIASAASNDVAKHAGRTSGCVPTFQAISFVDEHGNPASAFRSDQTITVTLGLECRQPVRDPRLAIAVNNGRGERIFAVATYLGNGTYGPIAGKTSATAMLRLPPLLPGQYSIDISLSDGPSQFIDEISSAAAFDVVDENYLGTSHSYFSEMGPIMVRSTWKIQPESRGCAMQPLVG
jgi:lipopolysaccharide transport system ATP-binding protein